MLWIMCWCSCSIDACEKVEQSESLAHCDQFVCCIHLFVLLWKNVKVELKNKVSDLKIREGSLNNDKTFESLVFLSFGRESKNANR